MSKTSVMKEQENKTESPSLVAPSSNNNLNVRNYGNMHPQDPRIRLQSNHNTPPKLERIAWGRTFPESSSPKVVVKSENEVKKEDKEPDEFTKMMILEGRNKEEKTLEVSDKLQSFTLLKQREEYMKKAVTLQTKIDILQQRRQELRGDGQRSPSPETKLLLKENTKIQLVHQNKLKNINNLIEMLNEIIGEKSDVAPNSSNTEATREIKVSPPKRFNYVFYDSELHWCRVCNIFPATATDYLTHLHSHDHKTKVAAAYMEAPWRSMINDDSFPTYPLADTKRMPIKGLQFFVPSTAWYCKLCDHFIGDLHCASAHLKSVTHTQNYSVFVKENPHWESDWMLDRQKAFEDMRLTVSPGEVDSFNIESINGKESKQKDEKKPEKYLSSPTSSSDSDTECGRKGGVSEKRAKSNDIENDPSVSKNTLLKRIEPLITDRKLLNDINSTKIPNHLSPPRSYRGKGEDRQRHRDRSLQQDDRHSIRHDGHYRHLSRHNGRQLSHTGIVAHTVPHDRFPSRYDRSSRARDTRSSERSRLRSWERRSERERSEVRGERERSEVRVEREQSEVRNERSRMGRDSPVSEHLPPQTDMSNERATRVGKITPFKIKGLNKDETKVQDKEQLVNRKEEMDAVIQKKVDEFKAKLIQIQEERQQKKIDDSIKSTTLIPSAPTAITTTGHGNPIHSDRFPPTAFTVPATSAPTDDLDMNQVVEMAAQILQQQAMLGAPFGMDPMCMPPPMAPMGGSILGPPPGLPMGMQPLMQMPFMTPFMGGRLPVPAPIRNRKRKPYITPLCTKQANDKNDKNPDTIYPPGEDK